MSTQIQESLLAEATRIAMERDIGRPITPEEMQLQMGQQHHLLIDDLVEKIALNDPDLYVLLPALSHLIRTTNITEKKTILEMKLRWKRACILQIMCRKTPELISLSKLDVWLNFGYGVIEDAVGGWRGRLVTESSKTFRIEGGTQPRKKFLGLI